jgi:hypothetical protein
MILNLDNNKLTGPIPTTIGQVSLLKELYFYRNSLTGTLPSGKFLSQQPNRRIPNLPPSLPSTHSLTRAPP